MVWSLWTELGLSGWSRHHSMTAVDLEPLVVATATLVRLDARLRDETLDWCIANHRFVSAVRLRNSLKAAAPETQRAFADFAATVKRHARVAWPGEGHAHRFTPTGRSSPPVLARPALIQLRLRAVVGVSVRAEILRLLLAEPQRLYSVAELAAAASYGKGNAAMALELLASTRLIETQVTGNQFRYRIARMEEFSSLLRPLPLHFPDWPGRFRVVAAVLSFAETAPPDGMARAVEARRTIRLLGRDMRGLGIDDITSVGGQALSHDFEQWSLRVLAEWTDDSGGQNAPRGSQVARSPADG